MLYETMDINKRKCVFSPYHVRYTYVCTRTHSKGERKRERATKVLDALTQFSPLLSETLLFFFLIFPPGPTFLEEREGNGGEMCVGEWGKSGEGGHSLTPLTGIIHGDYVTTSSGQALPQSVISP